MPSHMDQWRGHMKAPMGAAVSRVRTWAGETNKLGKPLQTIRLNFQIDVDIKCLLSAEKKGNLDKKRVLIKADTVKSEKKRTI